MKNCAYVLLQLSVLQSEQSQLDCAAMESTKRDVERGEISRVLTHCSALGMELEGIHTETGPGVYETAIKVSRKSS